jgi:protein-S-isoprenylcysteine O-methyltransferase Ste14
MNVYEATKWIWIAFGIFWLAAAFRQKRTVRRQSPGSGLVQVAIVLLAFSLFWIAGRQLGSLNGNFLPQTPAIQIPGVLLLLVGCGFAVWARFTIGTNWSGSVTVKENHVLITWGPYAWVRHPIYTGILLAVLGTALVSEKFSRLLAAGLCVLALWLKSRTEEQFMLETFGEQYILYRQRVKALIPFVV